jgi:hypothetical protein
MRHQPEIDSKRYRLDCEDMDYVWFDYQHGNLMLLEEKQYDASPTSAQLGTFGVIDQALRHAFTDPSFRVVRQFANRPQQISYYGYHLIQFEHTSPDDGVVRIDGRAVSRRQLIRFLRFQWTPTIHIYREQAERLHASRSLQELADAIEYMLRTIDVQHPEAGLLGDLKRQRLRELETLAENFLDGSQNTRKKMDRVLEWIDDQRYPLLCSLLIIAARGSFFNLLLDDMDGTYRRQYRCHAQ